MLGSSLRTSRVPLLKACCRCKHSVRVILLEDLPGGRGYAGEVHSVTAGHARNFLIPTKKALYANAANFSRVGILDPLLTDTTSTAVLGGQASVVGQTQTEDDQYAKAADFLRQYLRNKVLKIWRHVEASQTPSTHTAVPSLAIYPGMVDALAVRQKLAKQLKIDLDVDEMVYISATPVAHDMLDGTTTQGQDYMKQLLNSMFPDTLDDTSAISKTNVQIRQLGDYLAKIQLQGGHSVGLRFSILKR